ncbi:MAG: tetratricopeptide repeat protein, partial [Bacteroidales bacterium]|nr:tetratricopeptide repeat protein [Bacteroidales bacterium]
MVFMSYKIFIPHKSISDYLSLLFMIIFSLIWTLNSAIGQTCSQNELDSLKLRSISAKIEILDKIDIWNQIAKCFLNIDLDSTAYYAEKAKFLSTEIGYKKGQVVSILQLSQIEETLGNYDDAIHMLERVLELYEGLEKDSNYLGVLNLMGIIYEVQQDYDKALDYYMTGLREAEIQGYKLYIAYFSNNVSIIYNYTGFYDKELKYIKNASELFNELGHDNYYANSLLNMGLCYKSLKQLDTALLYFYKAEKLQNTNNNYYGLTNIYSILGDISLAKNQTDEALNNYQKSLVCATLLDSLDPDRENRISRANLCIGDAFVKS